MHLKCSRNFLVLFLKSMVLSEFKLSWFSGSLKNSPLEVLTLERATHAQFGLQDQFETNNFSSDFPCSLWTVLALATLIGNCDSFILVFFFLGMPMQLQSRQEDQHILPLQLV